MQNHFEFLIVGVNPGSILIGKVLREKGRSFAVYGSLEDAEWPSFEPACITSPSYAQFFGEICGVAPSEEVRTTAVPLRQKGEWITPGNNIVDSLPPSIKLELSAKTQNLFPNPKEILSEIAKGFTYLNSDDFSFRNLDVTEKKVTCGKETFTYDRLVWCRSIDDLKDLSVNEAREIGKSAYEIRIECWIPLSSSGENLPSIFLLPFKFREDNYTAFCSQTASESKEFLKCVVSLPEEVGEQSEEATKVLKALLRELKKEFGTLIQDDSFSRVLSYPFVSNDAAVPVSSYELASNVYCFLPTLFTRGEKAPQSYLERAVDQCAWFRKIMDNQSRSV